MRNKPSKFFPFEKPIYTDLVFYAFLYISFTEMKQDLNEFYDYGDSSRLVPLLFEFANSIFVAWIISMPLNWVRGLILNKLNSRKEAKLTEKSIQENKLDFRITKLDKPIGEMDSEERRAAAEKLSETIQDQIQKYKKEN
jgi:hypothetical protein